MARLLPVPKTSNVELAWLCIHSIAVTSPVTIAQTYPVNSVTQPCLLAGDSQALLGVLWLVSIQWSMEKAFAGIKNLTAEHKIHLYCIETSPCCNGGLWSCSHVSSLWVNLHACIIGSFLFAWRKGKARVSSQFLALSCRCGQEVTTGGAWAELVLRCMGPRAEATVWTPPCISPAHTWMTSLAAWPGPGSSSCLSLGLWTKKITVVPHPEMNSHFVQKQTSKTTTQGSFVFTASHEERMDGVSF